MQDLLDKVAREFSPSNARMDYLLYGQCYYLDGKWVPLKDIYL